MAIAPVGGVLATKNPAGTTLTATYSPTAGNCAVIAVLIQSDQVGLVVQDSLGNTLTQVASFGSFGLYIQNNIPSGVTGYTATWTNSHTAVMAVEEYSGASAAVLSQSQASSSSITDIIPYANDYLVIVAISGAAITGVTNATHNQQNGGTNGDFIDLADWTSGTAGSQTFSYTASGFSGMFTVLVGGPGKARVSQDVTLVLTQPTSAKARVAQDVILALKSPSDVKARVAQDVMLVIQQNSLLQALHVKKYIVTRRKKPKIKRPYGWLHHPGAISPQLTCKGFQFNAFQNNVDGTIKGFQACPAEAGTLRFLEMKFPQKAKRRKPSRHAGKLGTPQLLATQGGKLQPWLRAPHVRVAHKRNRGKFFKLPTVRRQPWVCVIT